MTTVQQRMKHQEIEVLVGVRRRMLRLVEGISGDELLWIPPGFRNNILWNLGHTLVVQQIFHYQHAGQPLRIPDELVGLYRTGSSPADWGSVPDVEVVLGLLDETPRSLAADYDAGKLAGYVPLTTKSGIEIANIDGALAFNAFHEGLHSGVIECMRRLWRLEAR